MTSFSDSSTACAFTVALSSIRYPPTRPRDTARPPPPPPPLWLPRDAAAGVGAAVAASSSRCCCAGRSERMSSLELMADMARVFSARMEAKTQGSC